jgi:hypothetical protein
MTSADINRLADTWAKLYPEEWAKCYPRMYSDVGSRYLSSRTVPAVLLNCWQAIKGEAEGARGEPASGNRAGCEILGLLKRYLMPTYYITPALLEAVQQSDLPDGVTWDSMHLTMPAATIMLPLGAVRHPQEGAIGFISYASNEDGQVLDSDLGHFSIRFVKQAFRLISCTLDGAQRCIYHATLPKGTPVNKARISSFFADTAIRNPVAGTTDLPLGEQDEAFNTEMSNLLFRILMAIQARPQLISKGQYTGKKLKSGRQIWTPNIIGKDYVVKRSGPTPEGSGGWNVRMHWRRGHLRIQPHGPNNSLRKTIWIEPMLIGAETQAASA